MSYASDMYFSLSRCSQTTPIFCAVSILFAFIASAKSASVPVALHVGASCIFHSIICTKSFKTVVFFMSILIFCQLTSAMCSVKALVYNLFVRTVLICRWNVFSHRSVSFTIQCGLPSIRCVIVSFCFSLCLVSLLVRCVCQSWRELRCFLLPVTTALLYTASFSVWRSCPAFCSRMMRTNRFGGAGTFLAL